MDPKEERQRETLRRQMADLAFVQEHLAGAAKDADGVAAVQAEAAAVAAAAQAALASGSDPKEALRRAREVESCAYQALRRARQSEDRALAEGAPLAIGVDMGGTKILAAGVDQDGAILARTKVKTGAGDPVDTIVQRLAEAVQETMAAVGATPEQLKGVGIGAPGSINYERGEVVLAPNLGWQEVPLKRLLEEKLPADCPVHLENDVNLGTLAECRFGIGRGLDHVVGVFWGTGIGGGVLCDGELLHGADGMAAEIGHIVVKPGGPCCGCGNRGCLEALASRTGISRQVRYAVAQGKATYWQNVRAKDLDRLRSGLLVKALRAGDEVTTRVMTKAAKRVGSVCASVANVLAPEAIIVGGGVMESMEAELLPTIRKAFHRHLFSARSRSIHVVPSLLADDAGILGGAALVWHAAKDGQ
jgi:glucokinase